MCRTTRHGGVLALDPSRNRFLFSFIPARAFDTLADQGRFLRAVQKIISGASEPKGAVERLFEIETDPITIIKWREMYSVLEVITDCCEDVANVIEGVVVKHG